MGLLIVLALLFATGSAVEVYTHKELEAVNGTDTRLKCTFKSDSPLGDDVTVSWYFRPLWGGTDESVFYYHRSAHPPPSGHFVGRAFWDGSISKGDGSIVIRNVQPKDNGTYLCQVKNPPDVHGLMGEVQLRVVTKVKFSEIYILSLVIGVSCAVIILLVLSVVLFRYCRVQKKQRNTAVSVLEWSTLVHEKPRIP
ncbi:myelin protein zero-like protein 2 isoform X2 [Bombina bombina]|uniref:myelin protein zero-like protein 2 isoform X2 n=1 Tax=Bombina bombina TaxID=8345 RepID=UPI00235AC632|nr:myelin protein zero-like protein 2 isoform X2 [Bombina bombina]